MKTADIVDQLGALKARIVELETQEKALRNALIARGDGAYEGQLFRATVSSTMRCTLDMDAVRAKLSPQFIAAHTRETPVQAVRVAARNGALLKVAS